MLWIRADRADERQRMEQEW